MTDGLVAIDLPCMSCGYLLRMQPMAGSCPECGLGVAVSVERTPARWGWGCLREVRGALRVVLWAGVVFVAAVVGLLSLTLIPGLRTQWVLGGLFFLMSIVLLLHLLAVRRALRQLEGRVGPTGRAQACGMAMTAGMAVLTLLLAMPGVIGFVDVLKHLVALGASLMAAVVGYFLLAGRLLGDMVEACGWPNLRRPAVWLGYAGAIAGGSVTIPWAAVWVLGTWVQFEPPRAWVRAAEIIIFGGMLMLPGVILGFVAFLWRVRQKLAALMPVAEAYAEWASAAGAVEEGVAPAGE
jgi:hypothetical protein